MKVAWSHFFEGVAAAALLSACVGPQVKIAPIPPATFERLGRVEGTGCGTLGIVHPNIYFIPFSFGSRIERARDYALAQKSGATALVDVRVEETWYWWVLATTRCTTLYGEAVR